MKRAMKRAAFALFAAALLCACAQRSAAPVAEPTSHATAPPVVGHMSMSMPMSMPTQSSLSPYPDAAERRLINAVTPELHARFATTQAASAAGYVRYTDEDQVGIISYTNLRWFADDPAHPTQLWFDARGRLIGADYTMRVQDQRHRPDVWGLQSGRWAHFISHIHYAVREPDRTIRYGSVLDPTYRANGGDPAHPTAQPLVRLGLARRPSDVLLVFELPEIWIASVWLTPNPNGAFAESDPLVKPTKGKRSPAHPS
jgi:hypothetical protein